MTYLATDMIPKDATHYIPATSCNHFCWIKFSEEKPSLMFIICLDNDINDWQRWQPILNEDEELNIYEIPKVQYTRITLEA